MQKRLLLHVCCAPCSIYPIAELQNQGYDITGYFHNPNIHPYKEFERRLTTVKSFFNELSIPLVSNEIYGLKEFLRDVVFKEDKRCTTCYSSRLEKTAQFASQNSFSSFSTSLLYSKYQQHRKISLSGAELGSKYSVEFIYQDFREGWQQGIDISIEKKMYRQPYCGCIYSEQERYDKTLKNKNS